MTVKHSLLILIPILLCAVILSGCTSSAPQGNATTQTTGTMFPMALTDDLGRTVIFNGSPQRIVSLAPSNTEILFALGLGDRVVGVDVYSNYPESARSKPKMGGMMNISEADVIAARPDLVLVGQFTPPGTIDNLSAAGLKCVSIHPDNATDTYRIIRLMGDLCDVPDRARGLSSGLESEVAERLAQVSDAATRLREELARLHS
jgi:iron complex transport system substrate-binding protein